MRGGLFATLLIAAGLLTNWPAQADEPKFTNLMGRVPTSSEIVEGLIMPLGLRLEPVAPIRENETADVTSAPEAAPAEPPATIALGVRFAFDSANLTPPAREVLTQLGIAMKAPALAGNTFLIEGHTDAVGSDSYNQSLSERRAAAVRDFLTREHSVAANDLVMVGKGETDLLDPAQPASGVNRRVEVGNLGSHDTAQLGQ